MRRGNSRHGISNQLLFAWRKAYREGRLSDAPGFVPAMMMPDPPMARPEPGSHCLEILSPNGWRVLVGRDFDEVALGRVVRILDQSR